TPRLLPEENAPGEATFVPAPREFGRQATPCRTRRKEWDGIAATHPNFMAVASSGDDANLGSPAFGDFFASQPLPAVSPGAIATGGGVPSYVAGTSVITGNILGSNLQDVVACVRDVSKAGAATLATAADDDFVEAGAGYLRAGLDNLTIDAGPDC